MKAWINKKPYATSHRGRYRYNSQYKMFSSQFTQQELSQATVWNPEMENSH